MSKTTAIRISVNRAFSHSEQEFIRSGVMRFGERSLAFTNWDGETYKWTTYPFHIRLSNRGKLWVHSNLVESRRLYQIVVRFLEDNFVNVHPVAVKTFSSIPLNKDKGVVVDDIFEEEAGRRGYFTQDDLDMVLCAEDFKDKGKGWEVVGLVDA